MNLKEMVSEIPERLKKSLITDKKVIAQLDQDMENYRREIEERLPEYLEQEKEQLRIEL